MLLYCTVLSHYRVVQYSTGRYSSTVQYRVHSTAGPPVLVQYCTVLYPGTVLYSIHNNDSEPKNAFLGPKKYLVLKNHF